MVVGLSGVSAQEDVRFANKESTLLKSTKFPPNFAEQVDMTKVNMEVMRQWIAQRVERLLGFEDDVLVELITEFLENNQVQLTGFLEKRARPFMSELWGLLLSAQVSVGGIPRKFVEQKKEEMEQRRAQNADVIGEVRRRNVPPRAGEDTRIPSREGRWDRGRVPINTEQRRGGYFAHDRDTFVDKRGNVTRRERDAGW
ncbi:hypothetical protein MVES1_000299 [Malassezia vespertilionis]|uniref:uncharacterized protein n=1 Tax=Malassezia vespertilionis TaxID=2020962 RepID=UPI0024B0866E|nr:uncharacterized protein MVES1_000299 [Malassezia vespertilionis]WFD04974.1 hypothetical protein MVES1_000299 [Malassezia vespertilionis]